MAIIIPANTLASGGYAVDNSCRFATGSSAYMKKAQSGGNREKWTYSTWIKKTLKVANNILINPIGVNIAFNTTHTLYMDVSGVGRIFETNALYRDVSAWYHIVVAFNTTDYSTVSAGQVKVYVNGVEQTFASTVNMSAGFDSGMNESGVDIGIGRDESGDNNYADQYLAETVLIDGQQLTPTSFGEFDEDSGIWKPIDVSGLTFGTNGFYLDFEDSANLGNDANGGTDFTEGGLAAIDQTTDTPTNNFATLNSLANGLTMSEGNLSVAGASDNNTGATIGVQSGKWYWEVKDIAAKSSFGIANSANRIGTSNQSSAAGMYLIQSTGSGTWYQYTSGSFGTTSVSVHSANDILNFALDADNGKLYIGINGSYINSSNTSANPATNSNPFFSSISVEEFLLPFTEMRTGGGDADFNFGSPSFAISSGNADADGYGNFEYAVPSGYYALCTKNLAEYG